MLDRDPRSTGKLIGQTYTSVPIQHVEVSSDEEEGEEESAILESM